MFGYKQSTGVLTRATGEFPETEVIGTGYAGANVGRNNPAAQHVPQLGPLPCGWYTMSVITDEQGSAIDYENKKAPVIRLTPDAENQMFGRSGFLIHGDNATGTASQGCMIQGHVARWTVAYYIQAGDNRLQVTTA